MGYYMNLMNQWKMLPIAIVYVLCFHGLRAAGGRELEEVPAARRQGSAADLVGQPAPVLSLEALVASDSPEKPSWESLRGKVTVLEFWGTWCVPCVKSIPHLHEVANAYAAKDVQFVAITDEDCGIVERFLRKMPIRGWVGLDRDRSMFNSYRVGSVPQTFVVDKRGKVAAILSPEELVPAVLDALLAGKPIKTPRDRPQQETGPGEKAPAPPIPSAPSFSAPPSPLDSTAILQIVIAPARAQDAYMEWSSGQYANTQVDLQTLLTCLFQLPTPLRIHWEIPPPSEKLRFLAKMSNQRADLLEQLAAPALAASLGLTFARKNVEADVYVLTAPGGPRDDLQRVEGPRDAVHHMRHTVIDGLLFATNGDFSWLVRALETKLGRPLMDETGYSGRWNWGLRFEPNDTDSLVRAAREQLGLLLSPERRAIEMVIVRKAQGEHTRDSPN